MPLNAVAAEAIQRAIDDATEVVKRCDNTISDCQKRISVSNTEREKCLAEIRDLKAALTAD